MMHAEFQIQVDEKNYSNVLIEQVEASIFDMRDPFDNLRKSIIEDIAYLNNILQLGKKIKKIIKPDENSDEFYVTESYAKKNHALAISFMTFYQSFDELSKYITEKVQPVLISQRQEAENSITYLQETSHDISSKLKSLFRVYFSKLSAFSTYKHKNANDFSAIINLTGQTDNFNSQNIEMHKALIDLIEAINEQEVFVGAVLDSYHKTFVVAERNNDETIEQVTQKIESFFPFFQEAAKPINRHASEYFKDRNRIKQVFYQLKNFSLSHRSPIVQTPPVPWGNGHKEFYARIWEDYTPTKEGEVAVKKKEMVKVMKITQTSHWVISTSSRKEGFIPCTILEPVE